MNVPPDLVPKLPLGNAIAPQALLGDLTGDTDGTLWSKKPTSPSRSLANKQVPKQELGNQVKRPLKNELFGAEPNDP